jgi:hypothetical protein
LLFIWQQKTSASQHREAAESDRTSISNGSYTLSVVMHQYFVHFLPIVFPFKFI